jgi:REP element-mobilizing transposase RayT
MATTFTQLYLHLVWSTWDRYPILTDKIRPEVYRAIAAECARQRAELIALGGIDDHVHLLVRMPTTLSPADLAKQVKGSSSHLVNHAEGRVPFFRWQGGYGAFSISKNHVARIREYVLNQEEHHRLGRLIPDLEPQPEPARTDPGRRGKS